MGAERASAIFKVFCLNKMTHRNINCDQKKSGKERDSNKDSDTHTLQQEEATRHHTVSVSI